MSEISVASNVRSFYMSKKETGHQERKSFYSAIARRGPIRCPKHADSTLNPPRDRIDYRPVPVDLVQISNKSGTDCEHALPLDGSV